MNIYEYWLKSRLDKFTGLGFAMVELTWNGTVWELTALSRGDYHFLGRDVKLSRLLRNAYNVQLAESSA